MSRAADTTKEICTCGATLPEFADRAKLAAIITARYFPISARTIRTWPLAVWHPNKKAVHKVSEALEYAEKKMQATEPIRQGG